MIHHQLVKRKKPKSIRPIAHMVGNAHIDPVWLWNWPEGVSEVISTCRAAIMRLKETKDFIFSRGEAWAFQQIEEIDPVLFGEIKHYVKEGRWHIVNGWWVQPDCNIPCGESFVRQCLYGKSYFKSKFGVQIRTGYNVDSFGHAWGLPQILKKSGFDYYIFMRPGPQEKELPGPIFWWEGPDGSRVLTARVPVSYIATGDLKQHINSCAQDRSRLVNDFICFYGVGNHGGGPTKESLKSIEQLMKNPDFPYQLCFSTVERFFKSCLKQRKDFPIVKDGLQYHAVGCYSVVARVKKLNRQAECRLMTAEKIAAVAMLECNLNYPQDSLRHAWKNVLFNQFHDILAGSSIKSAYEDADYSYGESLSIADRLIVKSLRKLALKMDTSGEGIPVVVFNPCSWERTAPVEYEPWFGGEPVKEVELKDEKGRSVPSQEMGSVSVCGRKRIVFLAKVPSLGYRTYWVNREQGKPLKEKSELVARVGYLENRFWELKFSPDTGMLEALYDKRKEINIINGSGHMLLVLEDKSDTWSHGEVGYYKEIGKFRKISFKVIEKGPVRATLRINSSYGHSRAEIDLSLYRDIEAIDCRLNLDWHEKHKMLKIVFPLALKDIAATVETAYGAVRAGNGTRREVPMQQWVDVTGKISGGETYGFGVLNDGKYGVDVSGPEIRMSIVRSPVFAHDKSNSLKPGRDYQYTDQGHHYLRYILYPHAGSWQSAKVVQKARELNYPLIPVTTTVHTGLWPQRGKTFAVSTSQVIIEVLKKAEKGRGFILRLFETTGRRAKGKLSYNGKVIVPGLTWKPFEIKTLLLHKEKKQWKFEETNLLEQKNKNGKRGKI